MAIDKWGNWDGQPDYGTPTIQGSGQAVSAGPIQGSSPDLGASDTGTGDQRFAGGGTGYVLGENTFADTGVGQAAPAGPSAADIKAQQDAIRAGQLRTEVTNVVNTIKDIYNQRYGQVDQSGGEQAGKLNERFGNESGDITRQVGDETNALGAAHAARGSFDSSYRANNVDTTTRTGEAQIRDLGTELQDNLGKIASWVTQQKAGFDAQKGGLDTVLSHLAESTDPAELTQIRNTLESRIADLRAGSADNNTLAQNAAALSAIAPSNARAVKLQSTLSQIVAGNAPAAQKSAIAQSLISNAGLSNDDQQKLLLAFQSDLSGTQQPQQPQAPTQPTA